MNAKREPNKKGEWTGGTLAILCFCLVFILFGWSAKYFGLGISFIVMGLTLYWSRRDKDHLFLMVIGLVICILYFIEKL
ncbi:MAG: hypothetical protein HXS48_10590 [Theionarchaea archaeon]|nr:hypothetical protein [Theionarchaea archaeon]